MKPKFQAICCAGSSYELFLYFLITGNSVDNTYFFYGKNIPEIYRRQLRLGTYWNPFICKNKFFRIVISIYHNFQTLFAYIRYPLKRLAAYGDDSISSYTIMKLCNEFFLLEDGVINYSTEIWRSWERKWWKRLLTKTIKLLYVPLGYSDAVNGIYLSGILPIPEIIKLKVRKVNISELWLRLGENEKNHMINFFCGETELNSPCGTIIILSQCVSEDNLMTEEEKIEIWTHVIKRYGEENVVLKCHPREKTNYKKYFPNITLIDSPCPFQLLELLGWHFEEAITLFSSAIFSLPDNIRKMILVPLDHLDSHIYQTALDSLKKEGFL